MWDSSAARISPIIPTGLFSPPVFLRTRSALHTYTRQTPNMLFYTEKKSAQTLFTAFPHAIRNTVASSLPTRYLLDKFWVAGQQFLPVDKNHAHLWLIQPARRRHGLAENLHKQRKKPQILQNTPSPNSHTHNTVRTAACNFSWCDFWERYFLLVFVFCMYYSADLCEITSSTICKSSTYFSSVSISSWM